MLFIILKLPRTGSTRLTKYLRRAPGVYCIHEILNKYEGADFETEISRRLGRAGSDKHTLGFFLNPFRHSIEASNFFNAQTYLGPQEKGLVISLIREDVLQQAVSYWLSRRLKMWPGDTDDVMASKIQDYTAQGGIELPPKKIGNICSRLARQNIALRKFSHEYAHQYGLECLEITYEGLYTPPHADFGKLQSALDIDLDLELVAPSAKVLPMPEEWVANYDQLFANQQAATADA